MRSGERASVRLEAVQAAGIRVDRDARGHPARLPAEAGPVPRAWRGSHGGTRRRGEAWHALAMVTGIDFHDVEELIEVEAEIAQDTVGQKMGRRHGKEKE